MEERFHIEGRLAIVLVLGLCWSVAVYGVVVDFDDLNDDIVLTDSGYAGLTWETGNGGLFGAEGYWIAGPGGGNPHSLPGNVWNATGCTLIGISFPTEVDVLGAYFAAADAPSTYWALGVRVHGYHGATEVAVTDWFTDIDNQPDWFAMSLQTVDRIVIESDPNPLVPPNQGVVGYYEMDDLTYVPEPSMLLLLSFGALALLQKRRA